MAPIAAITFDVGNTLMHSDPGIAEVFTQVASARGHALCLEEAEAHMPEVDAFYEAEYLKDGDFWCSHERATAIWVDMYRYLADLTGLGSDAEGIARAVHERYRGPACWSVYDDVKGCLRALKERGILLGVVSNWDAELEQLLRGVGLLPYFDEVVSSAAVGYRKPNPVIFDLACERLGVPASRVAHVGDLPEADGDGAAAAGVRPIIVDRAGMHGGCPYTRVRSLSELPALLSVA